MAKRRKPLTNKAGELREFTAKDMKHAQSFADLPKGLQRKLRGKPNPELIDDDNPEWTAEDFARARAAPHVLSPEFLANWAKGGHTIEHVTDEEYEAQKKAKAT